MKSRDWLTQPGGIANRLHGLRRAAGLSGEQLAKLLGWTRTKVPKIENGSHLPFSPDGSLAGGNRIGSEHDRSW